MTVSTQKARYCTDAATGISASASSCPPGPNTPATNSPVQWTSPLCMVAREQPRKSSRQAGRGRLTGHLGTFLASARGVRFFSAVESAALPCPALCEPRWIGQRSSSEGDMHTVSMDWIGHVQLDAAASRSTAGARLCLRRGAVRIQVVPAHQRQREQRTQSQQCAAQGKDVALRPGSVSNVLLHLQIRVTQHESVVGAARHKRKDGRKQLQSKAPSAGPNPSFLLRRPCLSVYLWSHRVPL